MRLTPFTPLKLLWHADRVKAGLRGQARAPVSVEWDLSNRCNHACAWCYFGESRAEHLVSFPRERALTLIPELVIAGVQSVTLTGGGEPLMHPDRAEILQTLRSQGMAYGLVTNGRLLTPDVIAELSYGATFVRISLDAGTAQTHQLLHATVKREFETILTAVRELRATAPAMTIGTSFCVFDSNAHEISLAARRVKEAGASYLEVRPVLPTEWRGGAFSSPLTADHVETAKRELEIARTLTEDGTFDVLGIIERFDQVLGAVKPYRQCRIGPLTTIISADGLLYHCCQQRGREEFCLGSILNRPFLEVWQGEAHRALESRIDVTRCPPCRYDGYNQILESAVLADAMHRDFI